MADSPQDRSSRVRRVSGADDARTAGALLDRFNREYDVPSPGAEFLAERILELGDEECPVLLAREGEEHVGIAVLRFRPALWSAANEAYLAELYVVGDHRRSGLGTELLEAALELSRERGCDRIELGTDEGDHDAHRLYRRHGFSGLTDPGAAPGEEERMFFFEREL